MTDAITLQLDSDGIAVATMDLPGRPMNVVNEELVRGLDAVATRLNDQMPLVALPSGPQTRYARPQ